MDTIEGGKWLPDQDLAWTLVTGAIERVHELENEIGCFFDRNPDGTIHQKAFAGQTFDRTVHKGDLTGIEIINRLAEQVWARGIARLEEHRALEFILTADASAIAGVLLVFCYLIVPSVGAMLFADRVGRRLAIGWIMGTLVSALGVYFSVQLDLPTGATIVCTFGAVLVAMFLIHLLFFHGRQARSLAGASSVESPKERVLQSGSR